MGTYFKFTGFDLEYVWEQGRVRAANAGEGDGTEGVTVNLIVPSIMVNTHGMWCDSGRIFYLLEIIGKELIWMHVIGLEIQTKWTLLCLPQIQSISPGPKAPGVVEPDIYTIPSHPPQVSAIIAMKRISNFVGYIFVALDLFWISQKWRTYKKYFKLTRSMTRSSTDIM